MFSQDRDDVVSYAVELNFAVDEYLSEEISLATLKEKNLAYVNTRKDLTTADDNLLTAADALSSAVNAYAQGEIDVKRLQTVQREFILLQNRELCVCAA